MSEDFSKATPRPWHVEPTEPDRGLAFLHGPGEDSEIIATLHNHGDARLIVAAVNAYRDPRIKSGESEADVERVEEALKQCTFPDNRHYYWLARAAIAAMQGARK